MKNLNLKDILVHLKGQIIQGNKNHLIKDVVTKPNRVTNNTLFFHLGKKKIAPNQFNNSNVIISQNPSVFLKPLKKNLTVVKVKDINQAYWDFVRFYRNLFQLPVIGVTGTCGKTTTTEMIKTILAKKHHLHSTSIGKNALFRNLSYLLGIDESITAGVFELGVTDPGNIINSCKHFQPQIGVLLNIGTYHLKGCKTLEKYIKAKAELLEGLAYQGTLILNADDENIKKIDLTKYQGKIISFGLSDGVDFQAKNVRYAKEGMKFSLRYQNRTYQFYVPGYGEHNVYNALAAITAAHKAGIEITEARERLASFNQVRQHLQFRSGLKGCTVIDDTWNCTPPSMESALKVLKAKSAGRKTIAVLGYMPQLGVSAHDEYAKIGEKVLKTGVDLLITIGDEAKQIGMKALEMGFNKSKVHFCTTATDVYNVLHPVLTKRTLVLLKFPYKYRLSKEASFREFMNLMLQ